MDYDYKIKHIGDGEFEVTLKDNSIKKAGSNLCGMIRYTYFEDFTLPPIGWETTRLQLFKDYHPKVFKDVSEGKIKIDKDENG